MTAREYFRLPDPKGGFVWELHLGELVRVGIPVMGIYRLQQRICEFLEEAFDRKQWLVGIEMPYGLVRGNDVRGADVGVVLREAWDATTGDVFIGSPDIVVQVKRDRKMEEDAMLHVAHGASAVWLVKPDRKEVVVITAAARQVYGVGQAIPLPGSASIDVSDIFSV
jgi:hypothetical protein